MKVAIIGANGQLGSDLVGVFENNHEVFKLNHTDIDVSNFEMSRTIIKSINPELIINTAAYHNVSDCETNPRIAYEVNAVGALNIARISDEISAFNVYYSTDYIFDGKKNAPYNEKDLPSPLNVYANTKLSGEQYTLNYTSKAYVLRISGIYGTVPSRVKGGNFISNIVKASKIKHEIRVVEDEVFTPTATYEIALMTEKIIDKDAFGLYHFTAEGKTNWYNFTKEIFKYLDIKTPLYSAKASDFPQNVKRPYYSVLDNNSLNQLDIGRFGQWDDMLFDFLDKNYT